MATTMVSVKKHPLEAEILAAESAIRQQQLTIERLRAGRHEIEDADREVQRMLARFERMLRCEGGAATSR
jgi:hypothetical protein